MSTGETRPVKLLHLLNEIRFSGAETLIRHSASHFLDKGFCLHALSTGDEPGDYAPELARAGIRVAHIPFARDIRFFIRVLAFLRQGRFDIVHIHTERAFVFYALLARLAGTRVVVRTVHSRFAFRGGLRFQRYLMRGICRVLLRVPFIAVSPEVATVEARHFDTPTILIPNWVDPAQFFPAPFPAAREMARQRFSLPREAFVICTAGACVEVKQHQDILYAMAQLSRPDLFFLHLGDGDLAGQERELAKTLGIASQVIFAGELPRVQEAFWASDLFVMTSKYEGVGLACLEAGACGLPAVVYDTPGLKDLVVDGVTGLKACPNPGDLARQIGRLCQDRGFCRELGQNNLARVQQAFPASRSLADLAALYLEKPVNPATHRI